MSHHFLKFDNVGYSYPDGNRALSGVSFEIGHGRRIAVVGANGAGKSTLLLHACGLLMPTEGTVNVGGIPLCRKSLPLIRRTVGMVFQNPDDQLFMPTVEEDVAFGALNMELPAAEVQRRVTAALEATGTLHLRYRAPYRLSGGQKKSVAIATVLSMQPAVLVMDEPTAGLDPKARRGIIELLAGFDHTIMIATHDMALAEQLCCRTIVMHRGRIAADGATTEILSDRRLLESCDLL